MRRHLATVLSPCIAASVFLVGCCVHGGKGPPPNSNGAATHAGDAAHANHAAPPAPANTETAPASFVRTDPANKTVHLRVIATLTALNHGMNFNGFSHGKAARTSCTAVHRP